jgi:hypothetical protein
MELKPLQFKADINLDVEQLKSIIKEKIERELDVTVTHVTFSVKCKDTGGYDRGGYSYELSQATVSVIPRSKVEFRSPRDATTIEGGGFSF